MVWNWQHPDWPAFRYEKEKLAAFESEFLLTAGDLRGSIRLQSQRDQIDLKIELLSDEVVRSSAIEGEVLDRRSVQSSIRRHLSLAEDSHPSGSREDGAARLTVDAVTSFAAKLTPEQLFRWQALALEGTHPELVRNGWRDHPEPMQIVSGAIGRQVVHFEAPPSERVKQEMSRFLDWFNSSAPPASRALGCLERAGLAHLYFESIHPFEDGNGRVGRAIIEKSISQFLGEPSLVSFSSYADANRKDYYSALAAASETLEVTDWMLWFAKAAREAQELSVAKVGFVLKKHRLLSMAKDSLNSRQEKALLRVLREGPSGFLGGLSAGKYRAITGASPATATRDLSELCQLGIFTKEGENRGARYQINFEWNPGG